MLKPSAKVVSVALSAMLRKSIRQYALSKDRLTAPFIVVCCVVLLGVSRGWAQSPDLDSVERLRQILRGPVSDATVRDTACRQQIEALRDVQELHRALFLQEWRDLDPDQTLSAIDRANRAQVADRFDRIVRSLLGQPDTGTRLAALKLMAEMGISARDVGSTKPYARRYTADLVAIIGRDEAGPRDAAVKALSSVSPDPGQAVDVFRALLRAPDAPKRLAGAMALANLISVAIRPNERSRYPVSLEILTSELSQTAAAVAMAAASGMGDREPAIRRACAEALAQSAAAFRRLVEMAYPREEGGYSLELAQRSEALRADLAPLVTALENVVPTLSKALADTDPKVRVLARQALEDVTRPQLQHLSGNSSDSGTIGQETAQAVYPASQEGAGRQSGQESIAAGLHGTARALTRGLEDPDPTARRAVIDLLESLGTGASPAAPALVKCLSDSDKFVCWSAARTLGKMAPVGHETAVPALARLLFNSDLDLQLTAAAALGRYGPKAQAAVDDLIRIITTQGPHGDFQPNPNSNRPMGPSDPMLRAAAIGTLEAIGSRGLQPASAGLRAALKQPEATVRQKAAEALGKLRPASPETKAALTQALQDDAPEVQKAASEALLKLAQPPTD